MLSFEKHGGDYLKEERETFEKPELEFTCPTCGNVYKTNDYHMTNQQACEVSSVCPKCGVE